MELLYFSLHKCQTFILASTTKVNNFGCHEPSIYRTHKRVYVKYSCISQVENMSVEYGPTVYPFNLWSCWKWVWSFYRNIVFQCHKFILMTSLYVTKSEPYTLSHLISFCNLLQLQSQRVQLGLYLHHTH